MSGEFTYMANISNVLCQILYINKYFVSQTTMNYYEGTYGQNYTTSSTPRTVRDSSTCTDFDAHIDAYSLACVVIIVCLSLLEKRSSKRCRCAGQRPGLVYPVNLLDHGCDNFGYSLAFGSVASYCFILFFEGSYLPEGMPAWSKSLWLMFNVLVTGFWFYPLFVCLTTTWVFVGSLLGLGYTTLWMYFHLSNLVCLIQTNMEISAIIAVRAPALLCLFCLLLRYGYIFIKHLMHIVKDRNSDKIIRQYEREHLGTKNNVMYVRKLLVPACQSFVPTNIGQSEVPSWNKRFSLYLKRYIYMNDTTFKYSPRIICIFTVALICAYQFGVLIIYHSIKVHQFLTGLHPDSNSTNTTDKDEAALEEVLIRVFAYLNPVSYCMVFSICISSIFTMFSIFQILTNYRHNIKRMYKGDFSHLPFKRDNRHAQLIMSNSLSYAGSQIASTLWGYVAIFIVLLVTCLLLTYLVILPAINCLPREYLNYLWNILPGFVILQVMKISQTLFSRLLLQTRTFVDLKGNNKSSVVLALDNRKVYHNLSYFLFFFYIVLGLYGCLLTIIKGVILGILYIARMDKCSFMQGYETWDKGYMYYVSFLHVEECHRHPVLLVFCDILMDNVQEKKRIYRLQNYGHTQLFPDETTGLLNSDIFSGDLDEQSGTHAPYQYMNQVTRLPRNRWFKAYTMIRNPSLKSSKRIEEDEETKNDLVSST